MFGSRLRLHPLFFPNIGKGKQAATQLLPRFGNYLRAIWMKIMTNNATVSTIPRVVR